VAGLARVGRVPPPAPANSTCGPPALPQRPVCSGASAFNGTCLSSPRRIACMMQLGFESDTLEIALREVVDVVDVVFLVESTRFHNAVGREARVGKPLLWEHVKATDSFSFLPGGKVVHIVIDDAETQQKYRNTPLHRRGRHVVSPPPPPPFYDPHCQRVLVQ
jgi:hypothetical protein